MCLTFPIGCVQQASSVNWTMCQIEELNLWHRHDTLFDAEPPKDITRMSLWIYIGLLSHVFCYLEFETINYEHMFWGRPWQTYFHIPISYPSQIQQTSNRSKKTSKQQTNIRDFFWNTISVTQLFFQHPSHKHSQNQASWAVKPPIFFGPPHRVTTSLGASQLRDEDWWFRRPGPWNWLQDATSKRPQVSGDVKVCICVYVDNVYYYLYIIYITVCVCVISCNIYNMYNIIKLICNLLIIL